MSVVTKDLEWKSQMTRSQFLGQGGILGTFTNLTTYTFDASDITMSAIKNALGASNYQLSSLCQHANINEWAVFKANKVTPWIMSDFLGYHHAAKPPKYWSDTDKTFALNVEEGDTWSTSINLSTGEMLPTSNLNGWTPIYMRLYDEGDGEPLVALQAEVDGVNVGGLMEWDDATSVIAQGDDTAGNVLVTCEYWKRSSSAGSFSKTTDNIEDGAYTVVVTQIPFAFTLVSADGRNDFYKLFGGASEYTGVSDYDIDYDFQNTFGSTQTRTIYWIIWNKGVNRASGSFSTGSKAHLAHATGSIYAPSFNCYLSDGSEHGYATMTFYANATHTAVIGQAETYHVERETV